MHGKRCILSTLHASSRLSTECYTNNGRPQSVEVEINLRPTASRPVCLDVRHPSGTRDQFFFLPEISFRQLRVYYFVAPSLTRGWVCNLLCNCLWALPEQSLLGRSPAELSPRNRVAQLYPRALSYPACSCRCNSQPCLRTGGSSGNRCAPRE
jgi:hypothetical protein